MQSSNYIISVINNHLESRLTDNRRTGCFHPSAISGCPRQLYESYLEETIVKVNEDDPQLSRIFDNGKYVHLRLQNYLQLSGVLVDSEVSFYDEEYEICGSADGIVNLSDYLAVLEIKSINLNQFQQLLRPQLSHIEQLNIYMYCLQQSYPSHVHTDNTEENLQWGVLLYECKNNQQLREFVVRYDRDVVNKLLDKITYVKSHILAGTIPPKDTSYDCRWCKFIDSCIEEVNYEIDS